ncbi:site-specific integrase [uncultured Duncaniella sp.]|uniref:tyrosine-type recombinase/integrase n=1 Tax=uncultured Duncaniella sp. TaxID=2768039 RepID=UPI0025AA2F91|nr:site-specific integrase [uncultured Duncaniella sp.]
MAKLERRTKQNPKIMQSVLKDGRISLYLEYYLGRSETPELDADGNQVYYTDGAMAGKPKYKVKHVRKKENLNLYLYANPKDQRERMQNRNTLAFAEKTRFEREQRFLEDREGYKFRRDTNVNFLDFFQKFINESRNAPSHLNGSKVALNRFKSFLAETPKYLAYSTYIRPDQLTPEMMREFADYVNARGYGQGPLTIFNRFKRVVKLAFEQELMRKNPCDGIVIKFDKMAINKEFLTLEEIEKLVATHYPQENSIIQRAFLLTLFAGIRYCDVSRLTYRNVDYSTRTLRFEQKKTRGRSNHSHVVIPLSDALIELIGYLPDNATPDTLIFDLPTYIACNNALGTWVKHAGIKKHITWHCGRHSFAVNTLSAGANIKTVSSLLGHSTLSMTERYLHVIDSQKEDAINSLGPIGYKAQYDNEEKYRTQRLEQKAKFDKTR